MQMHSEIALPPHLHVLPSRSPSPALSTCLNIDLQPNYNRSLAFPFPLCLYHSKFQMRHHLPSSSFSYLMAIAPSVHESVKPTFLLISPPTSQFIQNRLLAFKRTNWRIVLLAFPVHSSGYHLYPILCFSAHLRPKDSVSLAAAVVLAYIDLLRRALGNSCRTLRMMLFPANGCASTCRLKIRPLGYFLSMNAFPTSLEQRGVKLPLGVWMHALIATEMQIPVYPSAWAIL
ncbi:hypothetical protein DFH08DRAFT_960622 [Mycena albidolilacea]|uniref:Uncharacterized protein n=1 Tax=Mycena albidolilacea TaxID=1033008 RepID=A0AAD7ESN4_9AGAR|nr:hypothetical protein DFH08DRAFT_960622 [Mycena albidolilacea]